MRLSAGDNIIIFDGKNGDWLAELVFLAKKKFAVNPIHCICFQQQLPDIWLCAAPLRKRYDVIIEKACELGIAKIIPVVTSRTQNRNLRYDRLNNIMVEALEQCERNALSVIEEQVNLDDFLEAMGAERIIFFADENSGYNIDNSRKSAITIADLYAKNMEELLVAKHQQDKFAILIGPEGGFSDDERAKLYEYNNIIPVALGPRIMRAETAAIVLSGAIMARFGDWKVQPRYKNSGNITDS